MAEIKILEVRKILSADPARIGKMDTIVVYNVDGTRVHFVMVPKDTPTEADILEAIKKEEKARSAIVGKSFKVE